MSTTIEQYGPFTGLIMGDDTGDLVTLHALKNDLTDLVTISTDVDNAPSMRNNVVGIREENRVVLAAFLLTGLSRVEIAEALASAGVIPAEAAEAVRNGA